jgi:hypothetical protein
VAIDPQGGNLGSMVLTISMDQTGTIALGTSNTVIFNTPGQNARLTFSGAAGQQVNVQMSNSTIQGGCYSLILSIFKPDGTVLKSAGACGANDVDLSFISLPVAGNYSVLVDPQGTGSSSVVVTLSMDQTGGIAIGTPDTVTINTPGQNAQLVFSGTASQQVSVQVTNSTFPGGCYSLNLRVLNPDGTQLASTNMCGQGSVSISPLTLPVAGAYTVVIDPLGGGTGSAVVTVTSP